MNETGGDQESLKKEGHTGGTNSQPRQKKAIALIYDEVSAPVVGAKGEGDLAEEIVAIAREHGVPLYENPELVRSLARLEPGDEIPELLYRVIAEIIAFAYHIQGKAPAEFTTNKQYRNDQESDRE